jgi:hypothetical protein
MTRADLENASDIRPQKTPLREVPHIVIEPNQTCNLRCRSCYNLDRHQVKSLPRIHEEIDLARRKRNLDTVSLLGGEPTLHPRIVDVVSYVKSRGLICQILTNGIVFLDPKRAGFLDDLVRAGLDRIVLHADAGQRRPGTRLESFCESVFDQFEQRRLPFSLSITLYPENRGTLPDFIRKYARYRYFDGILATLVKDPRNTARPSADRSAGSDILEEHKAIARRLRILPAAYIPSSLDDSFISWLMYFFTLNTHTGATFGVSPRFNRLFRKAYRLLAGRYAFGMTTDPSQFKVTCLLSGLAEILLSPPRLLSFLRLIEDSSAMDALRFHYIVIQSGPEWNAGYGKVQICHHCPDATIRNGKITPVCIADLINPILPAKPGHPSDEALRQTVYAHLEED